MKRPAEAISCVLKLSQRWPGDLPMGMPESTLKPNDLTAVLAYLAHVKVQNALLAAECLHVRAWEREGSPKTLRFLINKARAATDAAGALDE